MKFLILIFSISIFFISCSSMQDQVIQRMDNLDERPDWATLSNTVFAKDGILYSVGFAEGDLNAKISPLMKLSAHNGKINLTREVVNSIGVIYQAVEEGTAGGELSRYLGTEQSSVLSNEIRHEKTYYEKVLTTNSMNQKEIRVHMYTLVRIAENNLRKLIKQSMEGKEQISAELKSKVDKQLEKLLDN